MNPTLSAIVDDLYSQGLSGDAILARLLIDAGVPASGLPRIMHKSERQVYRYLSAVKNVTVRCDTYIQYPNYKDSLGYNAEEGKGVQREGEHPGGRTADMYRALAEDVHGLVGDAGLDEIALVIANTDQPKWVDLQTLAARVLNAARSTFNAVARKVVRSTPIALFYGALRRMHKRETCRVAYLFGRTEEDERKPHERSGPRWRSATPTPPDYYDHVYMKFA